MYQILDNLRFVDYDIFFYLNNLTSQSRFWFQIFHWFAYFGIVLVIIGLIYLIVIKRINALFTATLSCIFAAFTSFFLWLVWQPESSAGYFSAGGVVDTFPPAQIFLAFAVAITLILYGNKKLGIGTLVIAIVIGVSRVGGGLNSPSAILGGIVIGIFAGTLAYWFMEHFEHFWSNNSAG